MQDIPTYEPTPGPTPTIPATTIPTTTADYTIATPTPSDSLVATTTQGAIMKNLMGTAKFAANRGLDAVLGGLTTAIGVAATRVVDRVLPTQGVAGTAFLSPRDAQHIPPNWLGGLSGRPWGSGMDKHMVHVFVGDRVVAGQTPLFKNLDPIYDSWCYKSPFSGELYTAYNTPVTFKGTNKRLTAVGGYAPDFAFGIEKTTFVLRTDGQDKTYKVKLPKFLFFQMVYNDFVASRGYHPYSMINDGVPGMGWPGMLTWDQQLGPAETIPGITNWLINNEFIAHYEIAGFPEKKVQKLRYATQTVDDVGHVHQIEYPTTTTKDEIPEDFLDPVGDTEFPDDGRTRQVDGDYYTDKTGVFSDPIVVLPSAPPMEDLPMESDDEEEPVSDEVWPFIKVQSNVDMSVGDGVYVKADGTEKFARGGMSAEYASSAETLFSDVPSVYGFVYGNGMLYGNTMPPGVMGTNRNMPNYNRDYAYYSRMVRVTTEKTRVGWFLTGNNATEINIWMLPGNLELKNQERLKSFEGFGAFDMNDDYAMARFASWLYALPNYVKDTYPYRCTAFEVDPTDGSGYYNGFM